MSFLLGPTRKHIGPYQKEKLRERLQAISTLEKKDKYEIARSLNISPERIARWFYRTQSKKTGEKSLRESE